ncbi:site-specific integrase [Vreelandella jeotgali]|uniref:site-specific integrase n=1 Tax=Vreelandella jeotgali TaxID=553386 RepID=UPI00034B7CF3|nr:site-specific integrase [Halomonas jeotgali]
MNHTSIWSGWHLTEPQRTDTDGEAERKYQRALAKYRLTADALKALEKEVSGASEGQPSLTFPDAAISKVFEVLHQNSSPAAVRTQHNFLVKGLEHGARQLGWQVNIPSPLVTMIRRAPSVTTETFSELEAWDALVNVHDTVVSPGDLADKSQAKWMVGRLVFQLIREGAVLCRRWLKALPEAVVSGVMFAEGIPFLLLALAPDSSERAATVELSDEEPVEETSAIQALSDEAGTLYRRVFLSPVSQLLLLSYYRQVGQTWPPQARIEACVFHYIKHISPAHRPQSLAWFIKTAHTSASLDMMPLLTHYASSSDAAPSLRPSTWHRLTTGLVLTPASEQEDTEDANLDYAPVPPRPAELPDQIQRLRQLQNGFMVATRQEGRTATLQHLEQFLNEPDKNGPLLNLLVGWAQTLIRRGGRVKTRLAIGTVATYLSNIARPLLTHGHEVDDVQMLDAVQWQSLYDRVISDAKTVRSRVRTQNRLRQFHDYVMDTQAAPDVELEVAKSNASLADTNIITPAEYRRALRLIATSKQPERFRTMQSLVLILGYRLGLRRSECAFLLVRDVAFVLDHDEISSELIVRANQFHTGKTYSATRRLPLWLLMPEEKRQLIDWCQRRRGESTTKATEQHLLFCHSGNGTLPLGDKELFRPIQTALKTVSGDPTVRYHHLRHSFVSFTLLRLLERSPGELLPQRWLLNDESKIAMPNAQADISTLAGLAPQSSPTRKRLWQLALWAGHATPDETLGTYSHLVDWALGHELRQCIDPLVTTDMQMGLLDMSSQSALTSWRKRHRLERQTHASDLLAPVSKHWKPYHGPTPLAGAWQPYHPPAVNPLDTQTTAALEWPEAITIYQSLRLIEQQEAKGASRGEAIRKAAHRFVVDTVQLTAWAESGEQLMQEKTRRHNQRFSRRDQQDRRDELAAAQHIYMPELHRCMAPPIKPTVLREAGQLFHKLLDWHHDQLDEAEESLTIFRRHMQRSTGHITLPDAHAICCICRMLKRLRCMTHTQLVVEVEKAAKSKAVKRYWAQETSIPQHRIELVPAASKTGKTRYWYGNADLKITREASYSSTEQPLWEAVRFSAFMTLLVLGLTGNNEVHTAAAEP